MNPQLLLFGHDTLECSYFLARAGRDGLDFEQLVQKKEILRAQKARRSVPVRLGSEEFLLAPHGTGSGYPFLLENEIFSIQCGPNNSPNFYVTYRSFALWQYGAKKLHERFLAWAESVGFIPHHNEKLSRVDFTFDYQLPELDFGEDNFITLFVSDKKHRKHRKAQTFNFGEDQLLLRVYDKCAEIREKSEKTWFYELWGTTENVWRFEWQARKAWLKRFGIRTLDDLFERQGDLLRFLVNDHTTLRQVTGDSNRSRWPMHPLWADLQSQVAKLNGLGIYREFDPDALLEERMLRLSISVYGYLKRIAAIEGINHKHEKVSLGQAMNALNRRVSNLHDPLSWQIDVQRRMDEMRLSPW